MAKKMFLVALIFFLLIGFTACYQAPKYDIPVYVTASGHKYHTIDCRYVKNKGIEINLSKAIYEKKTACLVCIPPTESDLEQLNR